MNIKRKKKVYLFGIEKIDLNKINKLSDEIVLKLVEKKNLKEKFLLRLYNLF